MAELHLTEVFDRAWRRQHPSWRAYALRLTRNPADADDVIVEAAARTLQAGPDVDSEERLGAYMRTTIRNIAFGVVQRRGRHVGLDHGKARERLGRTSSALQVALDDERRAERRESAHLLRDELVNLSPEHRAAIEMMVMRDPPLKLREAAERQGVGTSTVHYRLQRGLDELARALERARAGHGTNSLAVRHPARAQRP